MGNTFVVTPESAVCRQPTASNVRVKAPLACLDTTSPVLAAGGFVTCPGTESARAPRSLPPATIAARERLKANDHRYKWLCRSAIAAVLVVVGVAPAAAQRVSATVHGNIVDGSAAQAGATVTATNLETATATATTTDSNGRYVISGLQPGQYLIEVKQADGKEAVHFAEVGAGQSVQLDIDVGSAEMKGTELIEVIAPLLEAETSEVATNVSREQIENLPQNDRNFLNFAQLAPGVRLSTNELNRNVSSGGQEARQTNVFVDGVSLKNNIIQGGVVGQDASRGNPFPQLAVSGFRVLTQNFKAEYEQAGSSLISAVTRSGGNDFHAEIFGSFQNKSLVAKDPFVEERMEPKPSYARYQVGGLASGPIIKNRLFLLGTYEGNYQNRASEVAIGNPTPENIARFGEFEGTFTSPFREHLGFGKLTWVPNDINVLDLSVTLRRETDIRSFGGTNSFEGAENVRNNVVTTALRHQWRAPNAILNEATAQVLVSQFNPGAENGNVVGQDFQGAIKIGGRDTDQDIVQRTITFRDDVSFPLLRGAGDHLLKTGAKLSFQNYKIRRELFGNPVFRFREDMENNLDYDVPFEAQFGVGDPEISSNNIQVGLYAQDDWQPHPQVTLNLGLRWDVETDPLNNDYETPADVRAAVTELAGTVAAANGPDFFPVENYLTDGSQRGIYFGQIQPRLGASFDVLGDGRSVLFAGAGRYYDRTLYNTGAGELLRLQYAVRTFRFSRDGMPRDGQPTIVWDPNFLSREGLEGLIDSGVAPAPEIFLLENDTKPVHSDQYNIGARQLVGPVLLSATFSHIRSENGVGFYPANREATGDRNFIPTPGGFGNVLISADDVRTRFRGVYLTADKPYTNESKWGASVAYTLGWSKVRGKAFNFDFPTIKDTPTTPGDADERHRLVLSGMVGLPYQVRLSTLIALGTGVPYNISDASAGFGANFRFLRNEARDDEFLEFAQIDFRVSKDFQTYGGQRARVFAEVFNVLNTYNHGGFNGFIPPADADPNVNFGKPNRLIAPTRSFQLGLAYVF